MSEADTAPAGLRGDLSRPEWMSLPVAERLDRLHAGVVAQVLHERRREVLGMTADETDEPPSLPENPGEYVAAQRAAASVPPEFTPGASVVLCAGGCGTWLPARPGRPVLKTCGPEHRAAIADDGRSTGSRSTSATSEPTAPSASEPRPASPGSKSRKARRRYRCGSR